MSEFDSNDDLQVYNKKKGTIKVKSLLVIKTSVIKNIWLKGDLLKLKYM